MGRLCIIGVDDNETLKDFIRCHVDYLDGEKICLSHWYPDYVYQGRTIRHYYHPRPLFAKLKRLLPEVLYQRWMRSPEQVEDTARRSIKCFLEEKKVDVILAEFGPNGAAVAPVAESARIPLIVHFHGHDAHRTSVTEPLRKRYRAMFAIAFKIISVSAYMTEALLELGCPKDKILTNPYGPREKFFEIQPDYRQTFLALGRFTDIKANYLSLLAFQMISEKFTDARLVMVGGGELLETCKTLARVWGLESRVEFTGAIPHLQVLPYFERACCFVQHSVSPSYGDAEGTPVVLLEAQAAGLPVIATRHAGIAEAVVHGKTGFLVDEKDVDAMAAFMSQVLENPQLVRSFGREARLHIRNNYGLHRHIGALQREIDLARQCYET